MPWETRRSSRQRLTILDVGGSPRVRQRPALRHRSNGSAASDASRLINQLIDVRRSMMQAVHPTCSYQSQASPDYQGVRVGVRNLADIPAEVGLIGEIVLALPKATRVSGFKSSKWLLIHARIRAGNFDIDWS